MEDLEKYLFDPENPKGFKSYKLLAEIVRKEESAAFIDPYFLSEIFKKQLSAKGVFDNPWDKPDNFDQLDFHQKIQIYIKNYSEGDFHDRIQEAVSASPHSFVNHLFNAFIYPFYHNETFDTGFSKVILKRSIKWSQTQLIDHHYMESFTQKLLLDHYESVPHRSSSDSLIVFLGEEYNQAVDKLNPSRVSTLVTTVDVYKSLSKYPKNFHPIILKQASDVHALLDLVHREAKQKKSRSSMPSGQQDILFLQQVEIKNYFSIQNVKLSKLNKQKEIYLVGENGDGKTLLLQAILLGLKNNRVTGVASDYISENPTTKLSIKATDANKKEYHFTDGLAKHPHPYNHIFAYGINRFRNDSDQKEEEGYLTLFSHEQYLENPVKWLQHIDYREKSNENPQISLTMAKEILRELLDENVTIEVSPDKVTFNERGTEVTFNQLSDGYKSVIIWISDLIARLSEKQPYVSTIQDFRGIVLVDEIGVYLHPKWQYKIVRKLRSWFPHIQFIFTTHSPIVIMGASKDATFYKVYKEDSVTKVSEAVDAASIANLMANGIVTSPLLFGLSDARPAAFDENKGELDTSDDYLSGKIHQAITKHIQDRNNVTENEIMTLIQQELDRATTPQ